jgi:YggT family protein
MQDKTEVVETTTPVTRVNGVPRTSTEVRTVESGGGAVDRMETVAYDPYANKRIAADRVIQLVYLVFGLIEGLIAIRFVLKALGANAGAGFAEFIYGLTGPLVAPFYGLFGNPSSQGSVLEVHSLVALIVYGLLAWLIVRLTWILVGESRSAVKTHSTSVDTRL